MTTQKLVTVYAEATPNPTTMKFVLNNLLVEEGLTFEYRTREQSINSPIAMKLFEFPFVKGVFIAANFISVTSDKPENWSDNIPILRQTIQNHILNELPVIIAAPEVLSEIIQQDFSEVEKKISSILDEYVRPAVEGDGGAIHLKSFDNGIVTVILKGSCSGCPSSTFTLKAGIENLLRRLVPEVNEVVAENM